MTELTLREIQLAELDILIEFDKICRVHGLKYSLDGGTLLGAVRHKGFIPWDDDVDVMMPRTDYEKFIYMIKNGEIVLNDNLEITTDRGPDAIYPFLKLCDKSVKVSRDEIKEVDYLWIDIFPVDGLPDNLDKANKILKKAKLCRKIISFNKLTDKKAYKGRHSTLSLFLIVLFAKLYGDKRAFKNLQKFVGKYPYGKMPFCTKVAWPLGKGTERVLELSENESVIDIEFEGHKFYAVEAWDKFLKGTYGDYMCLPPEEERVLHGLKAYKN